MVVMGGDSCSKAHEFESWHHILDGHLFVVKNFMCVRKAHFLKKQFENVCTFGFIFSPI